MSDQPNESMTGEFKKLAENIKLTMRAAWESDERKNVTQGLEEGLTELSKSVEDVTKEIRASDTAQRIKDDLHDFQSRVTSGEVESKLRSELVASLKLINNELEKFTNRWSSHPNNEKTTSDDDEKGKVDDPVDS